MKIKAQKYSILKIRLIYTTGCMLMILLSTVPVYAQYTGGKGDGYASASGMHIHVDNSGRVSSVIYKDNIYPNPVLSGQKLWLSYANIPGTPVIVEIIDAIGRVCLKQEINIQQNTASINLPELAQGIYLLRTINGKDVSIKKLILTSK